MFSAAKPAVFSPLLLFCLFFLSGVSHFTHLAALQLLAKMVAAAEKEEDRRRQKIIFQRLVLSSSVGFPSNPRDMWELNACD